MPAGWLDVVYAYAVDEDYNREYQAALTDGAAYGLEWLQHTFEVGETYKALEHQPIMADVVEHISRGKVAIISNRAHMHLLNQLHRTLDAHWQSWLKLPCNDHVWLWPSPMCKLVPHKFI